MFIHGIIFAASDFYILEYQLFSLAVMLNLLYKEVTGVIGKSVCRNGGHTFLGNSVLLNIFTKIKCWPNIYTCPTLGMYSTYSV